MATVNAQIESLIDKKVQEALDKAGLDVITGPAGPGMGPKGRGIGEQVKSRLKHQWRQYTDNIIQAGKSTRDLFVGITQGTDKMDKHSTMLTKWMVKMVVTLPIIKRMQKSLKDQSDSYKDNSEKMGILAKGWARMRMLGSVIWGIGGAILMVGAGILILFGLLSAALEGAASPFVQWFLGLNILGKIATVLGVIVVALKVFGGAWSLIILGVCGLLRVLTQEMGFVEAFITTLISIVAILGGAFILFGAAAVSPFVLIGAAIVGIGILIWKFWDNIVSLPGDLEKAIRDKFSDINEYLGNWYAGSWLKKIVDMVKFVTGTIKGVLGGKSVRDAAVDSYGQTYGHTININVNGSADSSTVREMANQTSYVLKQNDRRQGGSSTTSAFASGG